MKIAADENIPYVRAAFSGFGEIVLLPGRAISASDVADADLLLVRSVTKVNRALLKNSRVRFVATATIGTDHIDTAYLASAGIAFAAAPGSNANSVGEYITAALLALAAKYHLHLPVRTVGIVGAGNVGSNVHRKMEALGIGSILCDPPLAEATGDRLYRPLDEIANCDIITLHVPMSKEGAYPTHHLVDDAFLRRLSPRTILINTSRGAVIDNKALRDALAAKRLAGAVLDVWENEPGIDLALLALTDIATPHIAGYSFDGKVAGTRQIYEAACAFLNAPPVWDPSRILPAPDVPELRLDGPDPGALQQAVHSVYDILADDRRLRETAQAADPAAAFDLLRKNYPRRREFTQTRALISPPNVALSRCLAGLGFQVG